MMSFADFQENTGEIPTMQGSFSDGKHLSFDGTTGEKKNILSERINLKPTIFLHTTI